MSYSRSSIWTVSSEQAHLPTDGHVEPSDLTQALAKGARSKGAKIFRHTAVTAIERSGEGWLVETSKGEIRAEIVVNAAGQWAKQIGRMVGVDLPIVPLEHQFLVTEPVEELSSLEVELPVLRELGRLILRSRGGRWAARRPFRA